MNRKNKGSVALKALFSLFGMLILIILGTSLLEQYLIDYRLEEVDNAITLSNLSAYELDNIDRRVLSKTGEVVILDEQKAFQTFKDNLKHNLKLENDFNGSLDSVIKGKLVIQEFIIYNVSNDNVTIKSYSSNSNIFTVRTIDNIKINEIKSPSGVRIVRTSVYTKIAFHIEHIMKGIVNDSYVAIEKDTDILE